MSVFSSSVITDKAMDTLMRRLQGERSEFDGWVLTRNDRSVLINKGTDSMSPMFDEAELQAIGEELGGYPQTRFALVFDDTNDDRFEFRMATAISKALADHWPILLDDHAGERNVVLPPGEAN